MNRGCHALLPHRSPASTTRCLGLLNPTFLAADPSFASRPTSKTQIQGRKSSFSNKKVEEGPLFSSSSSPDAALENEGDIDDSSAALVLPISNDEALSSFLSMDQTRSIPAMAEIGKFPLTPTSPFAIAQHPAVPPQPIPELKLWQGRLLVVTCAAICGTNYPLIKILDTVGSIPTSAATALRFALAAVAVWAFVLTQEQQDKNKGIVNESSRRRGLATWRGAEVGVYYGIAYVAQAMGLHTVDASKVRCQLS